jgi:hypothetical protein
MDFQDPCFQSFACQYFGQAQTIAVFFVRVYFTHSRRFFWGYFLVRGPSNLILHRIVARAWIAPQKALLEES